uniref:hypothetical protein n=1 Tax=Gordonia sp. B7-2 TaxID=3420932 RepID=UPI003D8B0631
MPLPTFYTRATRRSSGTLNRNDAASMLGVSRRNLDKLIDANIVDEPISENIINEMAHREVLAVRSGELTVLRTAARAEAYDEDREWIGFHVDYDDDQLEETSLRWWRSDADRVRDNRLYTVTVSTIPVAVYDITDVQGSLQRPGEQGLRYHYSGALLARLSRDPATGEVEVQYRTNDPALHSRAKEIMTSRVVVSSGGPIGYLEAAAHE